MDPEDLIDLDDLDWQEDWEQWIAEIEDDECRRIGAVEFGYGTEVRRVEHGEIGLESGVLRRIGAEK